MRDTLRLFTNNNSLQESAEALLDRLGIKYSPLLRGVPFDDYFRQNGFTFRYIEELEKTIEHIWNIGYVNGTTFQGAPANDENAKYFGLSIFACEIKLEANFTRSMAVALTRAFNRVSTLKANNAFDMPVIVIMRQGEMLSLATCERSDRQDGHGEKVGKVTMLRDMNCRQLHAGHKQILERIANNVYGCKSYEELHQKWFEFFNIDILSDNFFKGYKEIYEDIIEFITGKRMVNTKGKKWEEVFEHEPHPEIMPEFARFENPEKSVRDYVKNLMGRLVFIQFLQKKGWMGVPAGDGWIGGNPDFLQNLFHGSIYKDDFIDKVLEPLFNDLNTKRHGDLVTNPHVGVNIKVPYLNGGLFEMGEIDDTKFALPSRFIKKLLDFFASYNFTIDENAPDDVEIGVDPEMLSRIFENLLEDNKEKGAYYTPKEIVHYMCRESLISYLTSCVLKKQGEDHQPEEKIRDAVSKLLSEPEVIVPRMSSESLADFDEYIRNVKICDPAIGSGAFPMGLLNELVRCRKSIGAWARDAYGNLLVEDYAALKTEIICNNIYGVDIEKGAIDIARLRFWLSIIVDEKYPQALPNFDYKFMRGNSLMTTFNGEYVNLDTKNQSHFKVKEMRAEEHRLYGLKQQYYGSQGNQKHELAVEIKKSILRLVSMQLGYESRSWYEKNVTQFDLSFDGQIDNIAFADIKSQLPQEKQNLVNIAEYLYKQLNNKEVDIAKRALIDIKFFDWKMMFAEVFDAEGGNRGFDIVIGNPPYISSKTQLANPILEEQRRNLVESCKYSCLYQKWDLFIPFMELGIDQLCAKNGICSMIVPYPLTNQTYAQKLRKLILAEHHLFELVDLNGTKIFNNATVSNCIPFIKKTKGDYTTISCIDDKLHIAPSFTKNYTDLIQDKKTFIWNVSNERRDSSKHSNLLTLGDLCYISKGMVLYSEDGLFTNEDLVSDIPDTVHCRPYLEAKDMDTYIVNNIRYIEYDTCRVPDLVSRPTFRELYNRPKLMFNCLGKMKVMIDCSNHFICQQGIRVALLWKDLKDVENRSISNSIRRYSKLSRCEMENISELFDMYYLLGILNSRYAAQLLTNIRGGDYHIVPEHIRNIPIALVAKDVQSEIADIVKKIICFKKTNPNHDTSSLEREIDKMVYEIYGLTNAEVKEIDPSEYTIGADSELFKA